ncbi:MAG: DUF167 family protein [Planctomycetota bacterium]|nr:DUF167 family protein [Planctomycetota bacterium]
MNNVENLNIRQEAGGAAIAVKVVPASSRDRVIGVMGDVLKVVVSAPPEKGKANAATAGTLAKALGIDARDVKLVAGASSPRKEFRLAGMSPNQLRLKLSKVD